MTKNKNDYRTVLIASVLSLMAMIAGCSTVGVSSKSPFDLALEEVRNGMSTKIETADMPEVGDEQIKQLEGLEGLQELRLNLSAITDEAVLSILKIPNLTILSLGETRVTDDGLALLAKHPTLVHLSLDQAFKLTDKGMEHVATIPNLDFLSVWRVPITDSGCTAIAKSPKLRHLSMDQTRITGKGLMLFKDTPNLRRIQAGTTGVTEADIDAFNKVKPNCQVTR